jgi:hypothetical protein
MTTSPKVHLRRCTRPAALNVALLRLAPRFSRALHLELFAVSWENRLELET